MVVEFIKINKLFVYLMNLNNRIGIVENITERLVGRQYRSFFFHFVNYTFSCIVFAHFFCSTSIFSRIGDFNNDDLLDVVVGILLGLGEDVFGVMTVYPTGIGSASYSVVVTHFNNA
jgi:hypothetical protein